MSAPRDGVEPGPPQEPPQEPPEFRELGLAELLLGNLRVLLAVALLAAFAYGVWRAAALLFPDIGWLQSGE